MKKNERSTLLIVDDNEVNRAILKEMFAKDYYIFEAENGKEALEILAQYSELIQTAIVDIVMPVMDGYELLQKMSAANYLVDIPVVVITAEEDSRSEKRALEMGASDIIRKPFVADVVRRRINNVISAHSYKTNLENITLELSEKLKKSSTVVVDVLTSIIEHRSLESGQHIMRIRWFVKILLDQIAKSCPRYNLDENMIETISDASSLHDIGKIVIVDSILNKPGKLTDEEFETMKTHTTEGGKIVKHFEGVYDSNYLEIAYNIAVHHHERWDGRGYPDHLKGDDIPICAQAAAIADVYDALTTDRVYKKAFPHDTAVTMIINGDCGEFSPEMIYCFRLVAERFKQLAETFADSKNLKAITEFSETSTDSAKRLNDAYRIDHCKYLTALKLSETMIIEMDYDDDRYKIVNPTIGRFSDMEAEGEISVEERKFILNYVHPEDRKRALNQLKKNAEEIEAGHMVSSKGRYRVKNNETGIYEWSQASYMRIDTNSMMHHKALIIIKSLESDLSKDYKFATGKKEGDMLVDIFKKKGTATAAFSELLKDFGDMLFVVDFHSGEIYYGMEMEKKLAISIPKTISQLEEGSHDLVHPEDREKYVELLKKIRSGKERDDIVFRVIDRNGNYIPFYKRVIAIYDESGETTHAIGFMTRMGRLN